MIDWAEFESQIDVIQIDLEGNKNSLMAKLNMLRCGEGARSRLRHKMNNVKDNRSTFSSHTFVIQYHAFYVAVFMYTYVGMQLTNQNGFAVE